MASEWVRDAQGQWNQAEMCATCQRSKLWYRLPDGTLHALCYYCSPAKCIKCHARLNDKQCIMENKCTLCIQDERSKRVLTPQYILAPGMSLTLNTPCPTCGKALTVASENGPHPLTDKCRCFLAEACHNCSKVVLVSTMYRVLYVAALPVHLCQDCIDDVDLSDMQRLASDMDLRCKPPGPKKQKK